MIGPLLLSRPWVGLLHQRNDWHRLTQRGINSWRQNRRELIVVCFIPSGKVYRVDIYLMDLETKQCAMPFVPEATALVSVLVASSD